MLKVQMTLSAVFQNSFENRARLPPTEEPYRRRRASERQMGFADTVQPELERAGECGSLMLGQKLLTLRNHFQSMSLY